MTYEPKLDWKYDDVVTETDANRWEKGIYDLHQKLADNEKSQLLLTDGVQAVNVLSDSGLAMLFKGRTLVNLLGRDGNCEDVNRFNKSGVPPTNSTEQNLSGNNNSIKCVPSSTQNSYVYKDYDTPLNKNKYYLALGWVYIESFTSGSLYISLRDKGSMSPIRYTFWADTNIIGNWQPVWGKVPLNNTITTEGFRLIFGSGGIGENVTYWDNISIYEISEAEYNAIDSMTPEQVAAIYPYVDSVQHVRNPYVINQGRVIGDNLLTNNPEDWEVGSFDANPPAENDRKDRLRSVDFIEVEGGRVYKVSCNFEGYAIAIRQYTTNTKGESANTSDSGWWVRENYVQLKQSTRFIRMVIRRLDEAELLPSEIVQAQPSLQLNTHSAYLFGKDIVLADGERAYQLPNGEWSKWQEWEHVTLNEKHSFTVSSTKFNGFKAIVVDVAKNAIDNSSILVKYDGKVIFSQPSNVIFSNVDQLWNGNVTAAFGGKEIMFTASNRDSGWGDNYRPSDDEIKAYIMGWRMYDGSTNDANSIYDGASGSVKRWAKRLPNGTLAETTPNLPITPHEYTVFYQLHYKLAEPREVPVEFEGALQVHKGLNQIEVGTGVVVKESTIPSRYGERYWINNRVSSNSPVLSNKAEIILEIFRGNKKDSLWSIRQRLGDVNLNGITDAVIPVTDYDPTASYSVTYLVLDRYHFTTNIMEAIGTYQTTVGSQVQEHTRRITAHERKITVIENEYIRPEDVTAELVGALRANKLKTKSMLSNHTGISRWYKIARIQNSRIIDGGERASFAGTLYNQIDYATTGTRQSLMQFSFGVRGGIIQPLLVDFGNQLSSSTAHGRNYFEIWKDSDNWHYLYFKQEKYSSFAEFLYVNESCIEFWVEEDPTTVNGLTRVWSQLNGSAQTPHVGSHNIWHAGNSSPIVESGKNSNGWYYRFADGTQLCSRNIFRLTYESSSVLSANWTYPASFKDEDITLLCTLGGYNGSGGKLISKIH